MRAGAKPSAGRGGGGKSRSVTAEERRLWERVMVDVAGPEPPPDSGVAEGGGRRAEAPARPTRRAPAVPEPAAALPGPASSLAGLDKRRAQRLRRGQVPIDAELDLHGHNQVQAERALGLFLERARDQGKRCVLVITGKGAPEDVGSEGPGPPGRAGVLRAQVPRWLNEPRNRALVVAWHPARPEHGGTGALYVLLRRKRGPAAPPGKPSPIV